MRDHELTVDSFAGGGGASLGITLALGRGPDVAINHDAAAIAMHKANHPKTRHFTEDVWKLSPRVVTKGKPVGLLWASPDCRHFSRAKGAKPVEKRIRSLAWVVVKWAVEAKPRLIILENVREFADWGPLVPQWECRGCGWRGTEGQTVLARRRQRCPRCESVRLRETLDQIPDPDRKGLTFKRWVGRLRNLGYRVEWRNLNAADFGAPTHRRRLFLVARRDGEPIVWPEPTHAAPDKISDQPLFGDLKPYRTAAECIDWNLPCPSIFERERPLADKTLRRIALGLQRYVLQNPQPYIVHCAYGEGKNGRWGSGSQSIDQPLTTIHAGGKNHAVATPYFVPVTHAGDRRAHPVTEPLPTVTGANRGEIAAVSPLLVGVGGADYAGKPRPIDQPKGTVMPNDRAALVAAMVTKFNRGDIGHGLDRPASTVTSIDHHGLVAASLVKFRGECNGADPAAPMPTITSGAGSVRPAGAPHALGVAAAYLARFNHGDKQWNGVDEPLGTTTSQGNKFGLVYAFLLKYFDTAIGAPLREPLHTVTSKHRFGLVYVEVQPGQAEPAVALHVEGLGLCVIADIGLRMLQPHELALAQGFPAGYVLTGSKSKRVALIGNSVPPVMPQRLVEANYAPVEVCV